MATKKTPPQQKDDPPPIDIDLVANPAASIRASWWALHVQPPGENLVTEKPSSAELEPFEYKGPPTKPEGEKSK